jgi:UPF0755 protein
MTKRSPAWIPVIIVALLAIVIGAGLWNDVTTGLRQPIRASAPVHYVVHPGATIRTVASDLARMGVILHPDYLVFDAHRRHLAGRIKSGEYEIPVGTTVSGVLDIFVAGKVVQHSITLVEGWNFAEVRAAVEGNPAIDATLKGMDDATLMQRIGHPGENPEGRFFPDTYHVTLHTSDVELLKRAYRRMARVLAELWPQRAPDLPYRSPYDALIMASLIEKETGLPRERPEIAGVFVRRLKIGMKLQTDPTVIYGMGASFDGDLRRRDLEHDTPYNTYVHAGLPPTPIAMPGRASIVAALHPAGGKALYFVSRGDGSHVFSETLAQHNKAVAEYQLKRRATR